jgi:hypothetical protein
MEGYPGELADVALYLLQLASLSGIDLEQAILAKLKVNYERTWDTEARSASDSPDSPPPKDVSTAPNLT